MLKDEHVVVTGSAGFIGSRLSMALQKQGARVWGIDKMFGHDINDREFLDIIMKGKSYVFHMAVLPYNPCSQDMKLCVDTNIVGTLNVVEAAKKAGVKKFIYSSASAVYGNIDSITMVDEEQPCNSDSMYGASKLVGEIIVKNSGIPHIILRYMNVYGPGQANGLIPTILKCVANHTKPTIYGDGCQAFDFVHVDDVVTANILAAECELNEGTFNIGGENEIRVKDVVRFILKEANSDLIPVHKTGANTRRVGSSAKAKRLLGYCPSKEFHESIKELVDEYTNNKTIHG